MEQILQKNKKTFPVWNIIKKIKMVYNFRNVDEKHSLIQIDNEKHSLIQIDNEKNYIENPSSHYHMLRYYYL